MGEFLNKVRNEPPKLKHKSHFRKAYEALPESERDEFVTAVRDKSVSLEVIRRVLETYGIRISRNSLARARNGEILDDVV